MADEIKKVPHLTLLDLATPKKTRNTVNLLVDLYNDVNVVADTSAKDSADARDKATAANTKSDSALATAQAANATASSANATANAANTTSAEAKNIASTANSTAATAEANSEQAVDIANDSVAKIQHALDTGNLGTFVREGSSTLLEVHRTTDANLPDDTGTTKYLPTNIAVKNYVKTKVLDSAPYVFAEELYEESANLIGFENVQEKTINGVTYKVENGVITLNGTSNSTYTGITLNFIKPINLNDILVFTPFNNAISTRCTASLREVSTIDGTGVPFTTVNRSLQISNMTAIAKAMTINIPNDVTFNNFKLSPMIIKGTVVPTKHYLYNPNRHITNSEAIHLKAHYTESKNKLDFNLLKDDGTNVGITTLNYAQQTVTLDGAAANQYCELKDEYLLKPNTTYTFSCKATKSYRLSVVIRNIAGSVYQESAVGQPLTFTTGDIGTIQPRVQTMVAEANTFSELQIEEGEIATEYAPYSVLKNITDFEAEYLKKEYAKNKNLFDIKNIEAIYNNYATSYTKVGNSIIVKTSETGSGGFYAFSVFPILDVTKYIGKTFTVKADFVNSGINQGSLGFGLCSADGSNRTVLDRNPAKSYITVTIPKITDNRKYLCVYLHCATGACTKGDTTTFTNIIVNEGAPIDYIPYNYVQNITNSEAEFLKEEHEKQVNLFDEETTRGNVNNNTGLFTETSDGAHLLSFKYFPMKPSTVYSYKTSKSGLWIYEYDTNKNFLGNVDIVSGSSFISRSNTAYFRVAFWAGYGTTYLNDAIVKEGTNPIYYPYNSSAHITNLQADLLKNTWEKSVNEANIPDVEITTQRGIDYSVTKGVTTLNGTATNTFYIEYYIDFKSSNGCVLCAFNNLKYDETDNGYVQLRRKGGNWSDYVDFKQINNYKVIRGEVEFDKIRILIASGYTVNNLVVKPMLLKGNVIPPEFHEWNGAIIHKKDLENYLPLSGHKTITGSITLANNVNILSADGKNMLACYADASSKVIYVGESDASMYLQGKNNRPHYANNAGEYKLLALYEDTKTFTFDSSTGTLSITNN